MQIKRLLDDREVFAGDRLFDAQEAQSYLKSADQQKKQNAGKGQPGSMGMYLGMYERK